MNVKSIFPSPFVYLSLRVFTSSLHPSTLPSFLRTLPFLQYASGQIEVVEPSPLSEAGGFSTSYGFSLYMIFIFSLDKLPLFLFFFLFFFGGGLSLFKALLVRRWQTVKTLYDTVNKETRWKKAAGRLGQREKRTKRRKDAMDDKGRQKKGQK